jgi:alpha-glucosidase
LTVEPFRLHIEEAETQLHGSQPLFVFDNHDNTRSINRYGDGVHDREINRLLASLLLTPRAAVLLYYGEELGMSTTTPARREDVKDPIGITGWPKEKGRDGERTPMQWNAGTQSGFSPNPRPWLPVPSSAATINVESESADPASLLNWYRRLIALRRSNRALRDGALRMLGGDNPKVLSYIRSTRSGGAAVVVLNLDSQAQSVTLELGSSGANEPEVRTLLTDAPSLAAAKSTRNLSVPPFATWIAAVGAPMK